MTTQAITKTMTSQERVLAAIRRETVDHVPCSPFFNPLTEVQRRGHTWNFPWENTVVGQMEYLVNQLGVDPWVSVPISPVYPEKGVTSKVWEENGYIHKVWSTPSGDLHSSVKNDELWPYGNNNPFYHDFIAHYDKSWLKNEHDLECWKHLLLPARTKEHLDEIKERFKERKALADRLGLPIFTAIGAGLTGAQQLAGATELCLMTMDNPDLVDGYLELEHQVNVRHIEIMAEMGVDIFRRNGFYETADFYGPEMLERFIGNRLRKEIETAHQAGKLFGYTQLTGVMPILDFLAGLDFDVYMFVDTGFNDIDLSVVREKLGDTKSFLTGPSNTYHYISEDPEVVREAVREVFTAFGKQGLLISPCPSAHSIMPWENTLAMVDEWKKLR